MRKLVMILVIFATSAVTAPTAVAATGSDSGPTIDIPVDTVVYGDPGSVHQLAVVPVDPAMQGMECAVVATAENNDSVHPDSQLTIASGASSAQLADVESAPGKVTPGDGTLVLADQIAVSVTLGPDGVFSGGVTVTITCQAPPPTTSPPTTTTPPTTTVPRSGIQVVSPPPVTVASPPQAAPVVAQPQTMG